MGASTTEEMKTAVSYKESNFKLHSFSAQIIDKIVIFQVIKMVDSVIIFINYEDNRTLSDMSLGMFNVDTMNVPIGTKLIGGFAEEVSKNLAIKLSKRLGKTVFISYNVESDKFTLPLVEKCLSDEIKRNSSRF